MKKWTLLLALLPVWALAQERIMVIADPHVMAPSLHDDGAAFQEMLASQRKMLDLSAEAWNCLVQNALQAKPELLLIPGDLTKDGEMVSHQIVLNNLQNLNDQGIKTLVIPGNHDIGGKAYSYFGETKTEVETLQDSHWWDIYEGVSSGIIAKDQNSHSYVAEPLEGLTVLGIDGSHNNAGTGSLSDETLAWILAQADAAHEKGHMIISMCHWQLMDHFDKQGSLESSCQLKQAAAVRDSLLNHHVHVVLTGHFHVSGISTWRDEKNDSIVEITTGSPITYPCPYRWLTIDAARKNLSVETQTIESLGEIDDLYTYSRQWMAQQAEYLLPVIAEKVWSRMDEVQVKLEQQFGQKPVQMLMEILPQTNEERVALVKKHIGSTVIELYLLHSDGNEPDHKEADSLAQAFYDGMNNMILDVFGDNWMLKAALYAPLSSFAALLAQEPLQSIVEDKTRLATETPDRTDDLHLTLTIGEGYHNPEALDHLETETIAQKFIKNGQLFILRGVRVYTVTGQEVR